ncbi:MAG: hypothetical protein JWM68_1021 [Verrucomicrobiales bacterium]|nr:hypothetical protein [Verrucomicrobiales bacterium]
MYQLNRDQLETQARAKIIWGEKPETVVVFLMSHGLDGNEAWGIVQEMQAERTATIRASGVKKIIVGVVLMLVPVAAYAAFRHAGILPIKIFGVTIAVGVYGGWKLISGIFNLVFPESEQGDLADDPEA